MTARAAVPPRVRNPSLFAAVGAMSAFAAVAATLAAAPDYRPLLCVALVASLVALACAVVEYRAGGWWRFEAILIGLAAAFALVEFALRAPTTFR